MTALDTLHREIDARVATIRAAHPDWRCGKGCDRCCRQLADLPQLTDAEWRLLESGLAALPAAQQVSIRLRLDTLGPNPARPVTCPLLDPDTGACPVYRHRPIACRTYGFYVERDRGLLCADIEAQLADGALNDVVWGNQASIERGLATAGETRSLYAWVMER